MFENVYRIEINYYEGSGTYKWILWSKEKNAPDTEYRLRNWANADTEEEAFATAEYHRQKDYQRSLKQLR